MIEKKDEIVFIDLFFYLGVFLMPFDNLFFAPSSGWATIAPFLFFLYCILRFNKITIKENFLYIILLMISLSLINYIFYNPVLANIIDSLGTLVLGASFYFALTIFFVKEKKSPRLFLKILFVSYFISFLYGVLSVLDIETIDNIMLVIEKRHYDRLAFTFTEPSFISMHLFGVILPIIIIFKNYKNECRNLFFLLVLFCTFTLIFGSSARFLVDTACVFVIAFLFVLFKNGITVKKLLLCIGLVVLGVGALFIFKKNPRISSILEKGVYADDSLASRWFRINAILKGFGDNFLSVLFGFGIGNVFYPFNAGYWRAVSEYNNDYMVEVISLNNTTENSFFCGHVRFIGEFGLILYIVFIVYLFKKNKKNMFLCIMTIYLYIQFDSYAFYTVWILLFSSSYSKVFCYQNISKYNYLK